MFQTRAAGPGEAGSRPSRCRRLAGMVVAALASLALAASGWFATDALERNNDFCNSCHLRQGVPLHIDLRRDFDQRPALGLAAAHGAVGAEAGSDNPAFRCIDCHGGVGFLGRARVKLLAAKDGFFWAIGRFEEPTEMAWPLREEDCRKCHGSYAIKAGPFDDPAFHDLAVHNVELGVGCVECHRVHDRQVEAEAYFLNPAHVRKQCARCHAQLSAPG